MTVWVARVESDTHGVIADCAEWTVTAVRLPPSVRPFAAPKAADLPVDVRDALLEWLGATR